MGVESSSLSSIYRQLGMGALLAGYLVSLVLVWPVGDFPLLDDWVYARSSVMSSAAGRFAFTGYESAWSLPQIVLGLGLVKLVGASHLAFRSVGIISLTVVVVMLNAYLRKGHVAAGPRFLMCGLLLFNPVVYLLSMTFMSDLLFLVMWIGACFAWDSALTTRNRTWIVAAVCFSSLAIAQRQFGILIPCTVCFLVLWFYIRPQPAEHEKQRDVLVRLLAVVVTFLIGGALYLWMRAQGGHQAQMFSSNPWSYFIPSNFKMTVLLTLSLLPAGILIGIPGHVEPLYLWIGRAVSLLVVACGFHFLSKGESILYGNLLSPYGVARPHELVLGERPVIFAPWMNASALCLGVGMFCATIPAMLQSCSRFFSSGNVVAKVEVAQQAPVGRFGMVLVGSTCAYLAMFALRGGFDRYLIPALPGLILITAAALNRPSKFQLGAAYGALAAISSLSLALCYDYFRWNEVKWEAAQELVASGVPSDRIHAGYEWHGWNHGDSSPYPGGLSSGYSYFISFSNSFESLSVKSELEWFGLFPPFRQKMFVLERKKLENSERSQ